MGLTSRAALAMIAASLVLVASAAPYRPHHEPSRSRPTYCVMVPAAHVQPLLEACRATGVPIWLAASLIRRESGWDARAVNRNRDGTRDYGIMQLNSRYFSRSVALSDRAIGVGLAHLASLYCATGDWEEALVAYNAGLRAVRRGVAPARAWQYASDILGGG